ncbi:MAG: hypothetical protein V3W04_00625 [Gammaproteobacteria bacterium]
MKYLIFLLALLPVLLTAEEVLKTLEIDLPPDSLKQWYKPASKRNVWQHTMFSLRRELQAIESYAMKDDWSHVKKWADRFREHYSKIPEMVPEWEYDIDLKESKNLQQAVFDQDHRKLKKAIKNLRKSCKTCHWDYRSTAALQNRAPDFTSHEIIDEQGKVYSYAEYMRELMFYLNTVVIANADKRYETALQGLESLRSGIHQLGESCIDCHEKSPEAREYYLGEKTLTMISTLQSSLEKHETETIGRQIGGLAVHACAKCHGVHRISADMRTLLNE